MTGRIAFGAVILGAVVLGALTALDVVEPSRATWVGLVLVGVGIATALSGGRVLLGVGILVALLGVPALIVDDSLYEGGVGESTDRPESASELEPFRQGMGKLTVDLTAPGLELDETTIEASIGLGDLLVLVPADADVTVDAHLWAGYAESLGETEDGFDV